ncbi:hypothetical protein M0804_007704 [Polistes exclamans]|nr:hypothetical protein M0804_007704 [Polistes exclamans]
MLAQFPESIDGWIDGWMDGWMHGWIVGLKSKELASLKQEPGRILKGNASRKSFTKRIKVLHKSPVESRIVGDSKHSVTTKRKRSSRQWTNGGWSELSSVGLSCAWVGLGFRVVFSFEKLPVSGKLTVLLFVPIPPPHLTPLPHHPLPRDFKKVSCT